jgi:glycosyltransferase involved in cell wall biosynthesis
MKILLFYFAELGHLGGVETVVCNLSRVFAEQGHTPAILEFSATRKALSPLDVGVPVWSISPPSYPQLSRPRSFGSFVRAAWQFSSVARAFQPDVVHVHYPLSQSIVIVGAGSLPHDWRVVVTVHGSEVRVSPTIDPRIVPWQTKLFQKADAVTAVSQSLLSDASARYPAITRKASVIPNFVQLPSFPSSIDRGRLAEYILFVGRLHQVKGVDLLLQSWKEVHALFPTLRLLIAGDGPERSGLHELASALSIHSSVEFLGEKRAEELAELYGEALIVVLPSRSEGMPLSLLEAGASGALCIGTRIPAIQEILEDTETGLLADSESPNSLASAIKRALGLSPEERRAIGRRFQEKIAREFSPSRVAGAYLTLFESLRKNRRA